MRLIIFHILFIPFYCSGQIFIQQKAQAQGLVLVTQAGNKNIQELKGRLHFQYNTDELKKARDSSQHSYRISFCFTENGQKIKASKGFTALTDSNGCLRLSTSIGLLLHNINNYEFRISMPLSALALKQGEHQLTPLLSVTDELNKRELVHEQQLPALSVNMPPLLSCIIKMDTIVVDSLDKEGNLWDYFLLHPRDAEPDLNWSISYGGYTCFSSHTAYNSLIYAGDEQRDTFELSICKGDTLNITVKDIDELTPDDIIGLVPVMPRLNGDASEKKFAIQSGQLRLFTYRLRCSENTY